MLRVSFELIDLSASMLLHSILSCCITGQTLHVVSFEFIDGPIQTVAPGADMYNQACQAVFNGLHLRGEAFYA